jgi:hypothetical protein
MPHVGSHHNHGSKIGVMADHNGPKIGEMAKRTDASADKKIMFANAALEKSAKK